MRLMRASFVRLRRSVVFLVLGLAMISGCAKRLKLNPDDLARVQTEAGIQPLRVYTSAKLVSVYPPGQRNEQFQVQKKIVESSRGEAKKVVIDKKTPGLILAVDELNGKPLLWVTFFSSCAKPECAYGFVESEDGQYRLVEVPAQEGYGDPTNYHRWAFDSRSMKKGKLASLAEANEVFVLKKGNGKLLTIDLEVLKVIDRRTKTQTERAGGID